ncbi:prephenate dehydratase [Nocardiopsis changdeensis]|uniref:Prephenate dehydratase n=1 Tax=Nocardiopsis changdeensis TaxID=2831969 RepID=A0ABX8BPW2_9ACTN|nr:MULTISPECIES: prephenate dehydratase [Nocardiopsis]QKW31630.1 prephenate dehydratase [Nocardiopsis flavescens]QUX22881.1 prephenate dehydratase [Nocardiopsis changdeensis]QYX38823.1 prephenate dehydratase [Nocardiopsis sp. MT53]
MPNRYAYLGPEGTFTEAALRALRPDAPAAARVPCEGVAAVFDAVRSGAVEGGVVPLENSVEGGVTSTIAELINGEPLVISGETAVPVEFALFARPGVTLHDVKTVATHPHALAQCRGWLARHLPDAETHTVSSTAAAARSVSEPGAPYDAAICAVIAGERYGLHALATGVGDRADAATRFIYLSRPGRPTAPTGADLTSVVAFIADDHPGALIEVLTQFAVRGVNLTRLESRPTGDGLGSYCFCIDAEGHVADARVGEALMGLRRVCRDVRFLGSYPRSGRATELDPPLRPRPATEADYAESERWLARIRSGGVD